MAELQWADKFNCDRFAGFQRGGGSALNLAGSARKAEEYLAHAYELLELELSAGLKSGGASGRSSPSEQGRYRDSVRECSTALRLVTAGFIDSLRLIYPKNRDREGIRRNFDKFGEAYRATVTWPDKFPVRLEALVETNVLRHVRALPWVNRIRNLLEHEYKQPSGEQALVFLSVATMYCHLLIAKLQWVWEELELFSDHGEQLTIHFRPGVATIWYEYNIDVEDVRRAVDYIAASAEVAKLQQQVRDLGGPIGAIQSGDAQVRLARDFVSTIQSNVPPPDRWRGEVSFTDPVAYEHWLSVILAWSGRASE